MTDDVLSYVREQFAEAAKEFNTKDGSGSFGYGEILLESPSRSRSGEYASIAKQIGGDRLREVGAEEARLRVRVRLRARVLRPRDRVSTCTTWTSTKLT